MNKNLSLGIGIGVFVIAIVGIVLGYSAMTSEVINPLTGEPEADQGAVSSALSFTYFAIGIALAGWIIFSIWKVIANPKSFIVTGIGIVFFGIIIAIAFGIANSGQAEAMNLFSGSDAPADATEGNILKTNAGLITTYIVLVIAILSIVGGLVMGLLRYFKK